MILATPVTVPALTEIHAKQVSFPDDASVHFFVAFFASGVELNVARQEVVAHDAAPSIGVEVNPDRTSTADAFTTFATSDVVPMAAGQLKLAIRSGSDDASSLDALLAKAIDLGIVVLV